MADYMWGRVFRDIDITRNIDNLDSPILVALGRYDYLVAPPFTWEPYRRKIPNMTIRVFEKSGHTPQYEEPEAFDQVLLEWMMNSE
jgi:proline iminopeptidase